jgi:hypothetical protein
MTLAATPMTGPEEDGCPNRNCAVQSQRSELPLLDHRRPETDQRTPETTWKAKGRRWLDEHRYVGEHQMTPAFIWLSLAGGLLCAILVILGVVLLARPPLGGPPASPASAGCYELR